MLPSLTHLKQCVPCNTLPPELRTLEGQIIYKDPDGDMLWQTDGRNDMRLGICSICLNPLYGCPARFVANDPDATTKAPHQERDDFSLCFAEGEACLLYTSDAADE